MYAGCYSEFELRVFIKNNRKKESVNNHIKKTAPLSLRDLERTVKHVWSGLPLFTVSGTACLNSLLWKIKMQLSIQRKIPNLSVQLHFSMEHGGRLTHLNLLRA